MPAWRSFPPISTTRTPGSSTTRAPGYALRYGSPKGDATPLDPATFRPPRGRYLLAYDQEQRPVATGGWRAMDAARGPEEDGNYADGDAELKRMFVVPEARGQGLARRILAMLEEDAREAGRYAWCWRRASSSRRPSPCTPRRGTRRRREVRALPVPRGEPVLREAGSLISFVQQVREARLRRQFAKTVNELH